MRNRKRALYYRMNIESNKNENNVRGRSYYVKFILAPTVLCFLILQAVLHFLPAAVPGVLQTEFTFNLASLTVCSCLLALFCYYGTKFYLPWWRRSMIFFCCRHLSSGQFDLRQAFTASADFSELYVLGSFNIFRLPAWNFLIDRFVARVDFVFIFRRFNHSSFRRQLQSFRPYILFVCYGRMADSPNFIFRNQRYFRFLG